jgi:hypothetical protein
LAGQSRLPSSRLHKLRLARFWIVRFG